MSYGRKQIEKTNGNTWNRNSGSQHELRKSPKTRRKVKSPPPPQGTTPPPGAGPCPITCPGVALSRSLTLPMVNVTSRAGLHRPIEHLCRSFNTQILPTSIRSDHFTFHGHFENITKHVVYNSGPPQNPYTYAPKSQSLSRTKVQCYQSEG